VTKVAFAVVLTLALLLIGRWSVTVWAEQMSPFPADSRDSTARHVGGLTSARPGGCRDVIPAEARATRAARTATAQWEVHVGAMNKLALGAVTQAQAEQFWAGNRQSAARSLAEFDEAQRLVDRRREQCPGPPGGAVDEGRGCAAVIGARRLELDRAEAVLDTWRAHLRRTEKMWRGELSLERATQLWLASWDERVRQMDVYRRAAHSTQRVASAPPPRAGGADGPCAG
jgi:hypothetical protein